MPTSTSATTTNMKLRDGSHAPQCPAVISSCDTSKILTIKSPIPFAKPMRYVWPLKKGKGNLKRSEDKHDEAAEIVETIRWVGEDFREVKDAMADTNYLVKYDIKSFDVMAAICTRYNKAIDQMHAQNTDSVRFNKIGRSSRAHLKHIITKCYNRSVSDPNQLNHYEAFTPEVYGETSYELILQIVDRLYPIDASTRDTFIDLGSGVGQVVLQMAALTECKMSVGIEKANTPALFAKELERWFVFWMWFYGKSYSPFRLIHGDFLDVEHRRTILDSTIVFVNNFAFGPEVDQHLKDIFADLSDGARIFSSKSFCALNFRITDRNLSDIGTIMHVSKMDPLKGSVSWTGKPVSYYLHVIDRAKLERYFQKSAAYRKGDKEEAVNRSLLNGSHHRDLVNLRTGNSKKRKKSRRQEDTPSLSLFGTAKNKEETSGDLNGGGGMNTPSASSSMGSSDDEQHHQQKMTAHPLNLAPTNGDVPTVNATLVKKEDDKVVDSNGHRINGSINMEDEKPYFEAHPENLSSTTPSDETNVKREQDVLSNHGQNDKDTRLGGDSDLSSNNDSPQHEETTSGDGPLVKHSGSEENTRTSLKRVMRLLRNGRDNITTSTNEKATDTPTVKIENMDDSNDQHDLMAEKSGPLSSKKSKVMASEKEAEGMGIGSDGSLKSITSRILSTPPVVEKDPIKLLHNITLEKLKESTDDRSAPAGCLIERLNVSSIKHVHKDSNHVTDFCGANDGNINSCASSRLEHEELPHNIMLSTINCCRKSEKDQCSIQSSESMLSDYETPLVPHQLQVYLESTKKRFMHFMSHMKNDEYKASVQSDLEEAETLKTNLLRQQLELSAQIERLVQQSTSMVLDALASSQNVDSKVDLTPPKPSSTVDTQIKWLREQTDHLVLNSISSPTRVSVRQNQQIVVKSSIGSRKQQTSLTTLTQLPLDMTSSSGGFSNSNSSPPFSREVSSGRRSTPTTHGGSVGGLNTRISLNNLSDVTLTKCSSSTTTSSGGGLSSFDHGQRPTTGSVELSGEYSRKRLRVVSGGGSSTTDYPMGEGAINKSAIHTMIKCKQELQHVPLHQKDWPEKRYKGSGLNDCLVIQPILPTGDDDVRGGVTIHASPGAGGGTQRLSSSDKPVSISPIKAGGVGGSSIGSGALSLVHLPKVDLTASLAVSCSSKPQSSVNPPPPSPSQCSNGAGQRSRSFLLSPSGSDLGSRRTKPLSPPLSTSSAVSASLASSASRRLATSTPRAEQFDDRFITNIIHTYMGATGGTGGPPSSSISPTSLSKSLSRSSTHDMPGIMRLSTNRDTHTSGSSHVPSCSGPPLQSLISQQHQKQHNLHVTANHSPINGGGGGLPPPHSLLSPPSLHQSFPRNPPSSVMGKMRLPITPANATNMGIIAPPSSLPSSSARTINSLIESEIERSFVSGGGGSSFPSSAPTSSYGGNKAIQQAITNSGRITAPNHHQNVSILQHQQSLRQQHHRPQFIPLSSNSPSIQQHQSRMNINTNGGNTSVMLNGGPPSSTRHPLNSAMLVCGPPPSSTITGGFPHVQRTSTLNAPLRHQNSSAPPSSSSTYRLVNNGSLSFSNSGPVRHPSMPPRMDTSPSSTARIVLSNAPPQLPPRSLISTDMHHVMRSTPPFSSSSSSSIRSTSSMIGAAPQAVNTTTAVGGGRMSAVIEASLSAASAGRNLQQPPPPSSTAGSGGASGGYPAMEGLAARFAPYMMGGSGGAEVQQKAPPPPSVGSPSLLHHQRLSTYTDDIGGVSSRRMTPPPAHGSNHERLKTTSGGSHIVDSSSSTGRQHHQMPLSHSSPHLLHHNKTHSAPSTSSSSRSTYGPSIPSSLHEPPPPAPASATNKRVEWQDDISSGFDRLLAYATQVDNKRRNSVAPNAHSSSSSSSGNGRVALAGTSSTRPPPDMLLTSPPIVFSPSSNSSPSPSSLMVGRGDPAHLTGGGGVPWDADVACDLSTNGGANNRSTTIAASNINRRGVSKMSSPLDDDQPQDMSNHHKKESSAVDTHSMMSMKFKGHMMSNNQGMINRGMMNGGGGGGRPLNSAPLNFHTSRSAIPSSSSSAGAMSSSLSMNPKKRYFEGQNTGSVSGLLHP